MNQHDSDILQLSFESGWQDLTQLLFFQIVSDNDITQAENKLRDIGKDIAQRYPLPDSENIQSLESHINQVLTLFKWGFVTISPAMSELLLVHCAWPHFSANEEEANWRAASASVLEGLYEGWLTHQGGNDKMHVHRQATDAKDAFIFRYANSSSDK
ncbi:cellulose biosynthesis protein [Proteus mirabilis]|uniref:cellulose biosynthesis protein BcsD n=1 Tax=Proteus mirabilis TaxID=584 RepID=UPI00126243D9|nr:cellulose biosynthesis protein BcsD [Proteus mirabilis]KAB7721483.1 cellulose biosynthesis protein [Proteus mirabilis]MBG3067419.1 cellulose biosynthesis protein [Proteus mirabilis]